MAKKKKADSHGNALERFSRAVTVWSGSSWAFVIAFGVIVVWAVTGPVFHYSDTWQLVINTGTTIVTFLMVFLIQRAQNKESLAVQLKLDEIVASLEGASEQINRRRGSERRRSREPAEALSTARQAAEG